MTGARNFFRTIGGAFGLAFCSAILNNTLSSRLAAEPSISPELRETIIKSAFQLPSLTEEQMAVVMAAYVSLISHSQLILGRWNTRDIHYVCSLGRDMFPDGIVRQGRWTP